MLNKIIQITRHNYSIKDGIHSPRYFDSRAVKNPIAIDNNVDISDPIFVVSATHHSQIKDLPFLSSFSISYGKNG